MTLKRVGGERLGILDFRAHFALLGCMVAILAATSAWRPVLGAVAWFGSYGALHASAVALTRQGRRPRWRGLLFVGAATSLSMLSALVGLYVSGHGGGHSVLGPLLPLALSSGLGAIGYAASFRLLGVQLSRGAYVLLPVACVLATGAVLSAGIYRYGGGIWFAAAWWLAFSATLWFLEGSSRAHH